MSESKKKIPPLIEVRPDGKLRYNFHEGQLRAWDSEKRFVFMLAGSQSGKTTFGTTWLHREIQIRGDGDYIVASPSFPLQQKKVLPSYIDLFKYKLNLGEYHISDRIFEIDKWNIKAKIFFGSADNPDSLESATAKAAHLDEVGQKGFKLTSWEAILRRVGLYEGRILGSTTLYTLGWMKRQIYDKWKKGDSDIDVIQFPSTMNPLYPVKEYERAKKTMPSWKFKMFYKGEYDKPAGLIYDKFDEETDVIDPFVIPADWPRYAGLDFGGVNKATLWIAEERVAEGKPIYYIYREDLTGGQSTEMHVAELRKKSQGEGIRDWIGGGPSEDQNRRDYRKAGIPVRRPKVTKVESQIDRIYHLHSEHRIKVFNTCVRYIDEKTTFSRKLDEMNEPTDKIEDEASFHMMAAERYYGTILDVGSDGGFYISVGEER